MGPELYQHHLKMAPVRVEVELAEACNLRCQFCYNSLKPVFASRSDAMAILDTLSGQGILEIVLTGGEPLLHPDFMDIVEHACIQFPTVMVQTNGTLLSPSVVAGLKRLGVFGVNISLHGDERTHELLTQTKGSYRPAIEAIQAALNAPLVTWVNTVLTTENIGCLESHCRGLKANGVRNFTFTRFTPVGSGSPAISLSLGCDQLVQAIRAIDAFHLANPDCSTLLANAVPRCGLPESLGHYSDACSYGISRFYVSSRGEFMVCGMSRIVLGNILAQSIEDIKRGSQVFEEFCLGESLPSDCQSCQHRIQCHGGCRAAAIAATGSLRGKDPMATCIPRDGRKSNVE